MLKAAYRQSQALRQGRLDFTGHFEPKPMTRPPRLLVLACSATKRPGEGRARDIYAGPLWLTLKAADPTEQRVVVAALSAHYGLISADQVIKPYDAVIDAPTEQRMIEAGAYALYPVGDLDRKTASGVASARARLGPRSTPGSTITCLGNALGGQFIDVAIVGGARYINVARSWISMGWERSINPAASLTIINGEIGYMRRDLRAWIERD